MTGQRGSEVQSASAQTQLQRFAAAEAALDAWVGPARPTVGIVLGSGLGALADALSASRTLPYSALPGMPAAGVAGHAGAWRLGQLSGACVLLMCGRVHLYEGWQPFDVVFGVRLMARVGVQTLLLTNAAGALAPDARPGDLLAISDQLNLSGQNCLAGPAGAHFGPRFVDMCAAYDPALRHALRSAADAHAIPLRQGVYAGLLGPSYETPAEVRMLQQLGADAVGMSTVQETLAARQLGMRVAGLSCLTNLAAGLGARTLDHEDVQQQGAAASARSLTLIEAWLHATKLSPA
ncbi:MAG: purine-nucleoside phosphorylase [Polyangiales bacterium]